MAKTGESYTAARAVLLSRSTRPRVKPVPETKPAAVIAEQPKIDPKDFAKLAGMSDEAIKKNTGCAWDKWVKSLDAHKAYEWPHGKIAEFVHTKYKVKDWWTQSVTVGYERIKGLREIGQRRGGAWEANKSKVVPVPLAKLYKAFSDRRQRMPWFGETPFAVRKANANKSMRLTWDDDSSVEIMFYAKGAAKSQVTITHRKLPDRAAMDRSKAFWTERLAALVEALKR